MPSGPIHAIIWDFDNTLVDTRAKNLSVTRRIIERVTGRPADDFAPLRSLAAYDRAIHDTQDWQSLYEVDFGLEPEQVVEAGGLWTEYQLSDPTPAHWFDGVVEVVRALDPFPQAIVSMNTRANIRDKLRSARLNGVFELVIGCEEVRFHRQKPAPDGLLHCLEALAALDSPHVIYVGDHPVDAACAANANQVLAARGAGVRILAIGADYGTSAGHSAWPIEPHHRAATPSDILTIAETVTADAMAP